MLEQTYERLNALAKINSASKYLEIGVAEGTTFHKVNIPYKVAVDPNFRFNAKERANQNTIFHEVTSDVFFSSLALQYGKFGLVYLDGLHTFEQTFRDFCASLAYSKDTTIWLIDDTHPSSRLASIPNPKLAYGLRKFSPVEDSRWMGDVFKVIFAIHDFFPQFSYATFPGHGQTVIYLQSRRNFNPT
jgi:hypothetical protein